MPYRKRRYYKRRPYTFRKRRFNFAKSVKRIVQKQAETKFGLTTYSDETIDGTGATPVSTHLTAIGQGDNQNNREGNRITLTGIHGRIHFQRDASASSNSTTIRAVLYHPKADAAELSTTDITDSIDMDKYTVLMDRLIIIPDDRDAAYMDIRRKFNFGKRSGINVQYSGSSGANISKNALYLYMVSDETTYPPFGNGIIRTYFKDM